LAAVSVHTSIGVPAGPPGSERLALDLVVEKPALG